MAGANTHTGRALDAVYLGRTGSTGSQCLQLLLNRSFLRAVHNIANHRTRGEVAAVERVRGKVAGRGVRSAHNHGRIHGRHSVRRGGGACVQLAGRGSNHRGQGGAGRSGGGHLRSVQRQVLGQVQTEDFGGTGGIRAVDANLQVESARAHHRGVNEVLTVSRTNDDDVLQRLHAVDFGQQLRHDGRLNI